MKGYAQSYGIYFIDVFAHVAKIETIKVLLAILAYFGCEVHHLDVNGEISEGIYVRKLEGYEVLGKENFLYKLKKDLYGLKHGPQAWCSKLDKSLIHVGLTRSSHEPAVYFSVKNSCKICVGMYVHDLLVSSNTMLDIAH